MKKAALVLVVLYRKWVSPQLGNHCRFHPTCSDYAEQAIHKKGTWRGIGVSLLRILKCHPFYPGGFDPVE